jgi:hypothetical protein
MFQACFVGNTGCCLLFALIGAVITPYYARAEYRQLQGHWPQAIWVARLYAVSMEGICLLILVWSIDFLSNTIGNSPLVTSINSPWTWMLVLTIGVGSPTLLALFGLLALTISQRLRYGLPPRTPPA